MEFNVLAYGAQRGLDPSNVDNSFDNFAAFKAALDDARTYKQSNPGKPAAVKVPFGDWYVRMNPAGVATASEPLTLYVDSEDPIDFVGDGMNHTFIKCGPQAFSGYTNLFLIWHGAIRLRDFHVEAPDTQVIPGIAGAVNFFFHNCGGGSEKQNFTNVKITQFHAGIQSTDDLAVGLENGRTEIHLKDCFVTGRESAVFMQGTKDGRSILDIDGGYYATDDPLAIASVPGSTIYTSNNAGKVRLRNCVIEHLQPNFNYGWQSTGGGTPPFDTNYPEPIGAELENVTFINANKGILPTLWAKTKLKNVKWLSTWPIQDGIRLRGSATGPRGGLEGDGLVIDVDLQPGAPFMNYFSGQSPQEDQVTLLKNVDAYITGFGARFFKDNFILPNRTIIEVRDSFIEMDDAATIGFQSEQMDRTFIFDNLELMAQGRWTLMRAGTLTSTNSYWHQGASTLHELLADAGDITASFSGDTFEGPFMDPLLQVPLGFTITAAGLNNTFILPATQPSWSTVGSVSVAFTDVQYVRLRVFGSTTGGTSQYDDPTIQALIDQSEGVLFAAAELAAALKALYASKLTRAIGKTKVDLSDLFDHYCRLYETLLHDAQNGGDGTGVAKAEMEVGGTTYSEFKEAGQDSDRIRENFSIGMNSPLRRRRRFPNGYSEY